jgi:hypothetical protein
VSSSSPSKTNTSSSSSFSTFLNQVRFGFAAVFFCLVEEEVDAAASGFVVVLRCRFRGMVVEEKERGRWRGAV